MHSLDDTNQGAKNDVQASAKFKEQGAPNSGIHQFSITVIGRGNWSMIFVTGNRRTREPVFGLMRNLQWLEQESSR